MFEVSVPVVVRVDTEVVLTEVAVAVVVVTVVVLRVVVLVETDVVEWVVLSVDVTFCMHQTSPLSLFAIRHE